MSLFRNILANTGNPAVNITPQDYSAEGNFLSPAAMPQYNMPAQPAPRPATVPAPAAPGVPVARQAGAMPVPAGPVQPSLATHPTVQELNAAMHAGEFEGLTGPNGTPLSYAMRNKPAGSMTRADWANWLRSQQEQQIAQEGEFGPGAPAPVGGMTVGEAKQAIRRYQDYRKYGEFGGAPVAAPMPQARPTMAAQAPTTQMSARGTPPAQAGDMGAGHTYMVAGKPVTGLQSPIAPQYTQMLLNAEGFLGTAKWDHKQWTNGFGTRAKYPGEKISRAEAAKRYTQDIVPRYNRVTKFAPNAPEGVKAALTDLSFNAGFAWEKAGLGAAIRAGNWAEAKRRFLQYTKASGRHHKGLARRRLQFARVFDQAEAQQTFQRVVNS